MLEPIILEITKTTPEIILDKDNNVFKISGRAIIENSQEFFNPIISWFEEYFKKPNSKTELTLNIDYLNSSSSLFLMKIFVLFEQNINTNNKIIWMYDASDDLIKERGEEYKLLTKLNFELKETINEDYEDFNFDI